MTYAFLTTRGTSGLLKIERELYDEGGRLNGCRVSWKYADDLPPASDVQWTGVYRGQLMEKEVEWKIVDVDGSYHILESPDDKPGEGNRLEEVVGGLLIDGGSKVACPG